MCSCVAVLSCALCMCCRALAQDVLCTVTMRLLLLLLLLDVLGSICSHSKLSSSVLGVQLPC